MSNIPLPLRIDIVRHLGHYSFRELGPLIATGRDGMCLVLDERVLEEVDIDEYIFVSPLADERSIYRPFLMKCLEAGNVNAKYVVGLRLAALSGPSQHSIDLLVAAAKYIMYARFALGAFLICCGSFDQGMNVFKSFLNKVATVEEAIGIAEMVVTQITDMKKHSSGLYDNTLWFGGLPNCFLNNYSILQLYPKCFAFLYATKIQDLC